MKYVARLRFFPRRENKESIRRLLKDQDIQFREKVVAGDVLMEASFDKSDPRLISFQATLKEMKQDPPIFYEPSFEPRELDEAQLIQLTIRGLVGESLGSWASELGLPPDVLVMDKSKMKRQDIALTYGFEAVMSERLKEILEHENLTGWKAELIQHKDNKNDQFSPLYYLTSTNVLPPVMPETEISEYARSESPRKPIGHPLQAFPELSQSLCKHQRGPLLYSQEVLRLVQDINWTRELFGEPRVAQPLFIISQRTWDVLQKYRIGKVEAEPVGIV